MHLESDFPQFVITLLRTHEKPNGQLQINLGEEINFISRSLMSGQQQISFVRHRGLLGIYTYSFWELSRGQGDLLLIVKPKYHSDRLKGLLGMRGAALSPLYYTCWEHTSEIQESCTQLNQDTPKALLSVQRSFCQEISYKINIRTWSSSCQHMTAPDTGSSCQITKLYSITPQMEN